MKEIGHIKWFGGRNSNIGRDNNYGFISREGKPDIYIHRQQITCALSDLREGTPVTFEVAINTRNGKEEAKNLRLLNLSEERDLEIVQLCVKSQNRKLWEPLFGRYLATLPINEAVSFTLAKINSLSEREKRIFVQSKLPKSILLSSQARAIRSILAANEHLSICLEMLPSGVNIAINSTLTEEIVAILETANPLDREILSRLQTVLPNIADIKNALGKQYIQRCSIKFLYHMTHIDNLSSILSNGLLSHNEAHRRNMVKTDISMEEAQQWRRHLHDFVPFYFNPRNTMLYKRKDMQNNIIMLAIDPLLLMQPNTYFSDGNAAARATKLYNDLALLDQLPWHIINSSSWNDDDPLVKEMRKRTMCAEVLVYNKVDVKRILKIFCRSSFKIDTIQQLMPSGINIPVEVNPLLYF